MTKKLNGSENERAPKNTLPLQIDQNKALVTSETINSRVCYRSDWLLFSELHYPELTDLSLILALLVLHLLILGLHKVTIVASANKQS